MSCPEEGCLQQEQDRQMLTEDRGQGAEGGWRPENGFRGRWGPCPAGPRGPSFLSKVMETLLVLQRCFWLQGAAVGRGPGRQGRGEEESQHRLQEGLMERPARPSGSHYTDRLQKGNSLLTNCLLCAGLGPTWGWKTHTLRATQLGRDSQGTQPRCSPVHLSSQAGSLSPQSPSKALGQGPRWPVPAA